MKKTLFSIMMAVIISFHSLSFGYAAGTPLPEKLEKQITYGSGISGSFRFTVDGDLSKSPFCQAVSDADFSIRGLVSGTDFLCSVFQTDQLEQQTGCTELYRDINQYYIRSDMVQGKVISFPDKTEMIDTLFLRKGENPSPASFIAELTSLSELNGKSTLDSLLSRYRYELELWLSRYITEGVFVRLEDGQSAFDSSYDIPISEFKSLILKLMSELTNDTEVSDFLDSIMTPEQKAVYMNHNLLYFYEEALNALHLQQDVHINRRASTLGAVISTDLMLPLDQDITGYHTLSIHSEKDHITYSLLGDQQAFIVSLPEKKQSTQNNDEKEYILTKINSNNKNESNCNISVRINIQKSTETYDDDEGRSHQKDQYHIVIQQDESYLPESYDRSVITPFQKVEADINLHYYSKFAQNSSTKLEFNAKAKQGNSNISVQGIVMTVNSNSWVFKPFDISHSIHADAGNTEVLTSYFTDWVSNAASMIHHSAPSDDMTGNTSEDDTSKTMNNNTEPTNQTQEETDDSSNTETAPLPDT